MISNGSSGHRDPRSCGGDLFAGLRWLTTVKPSFGRRKGRTRAVAGTHNYSRGPSSPPAWAPEISKPVAILYAAVRLTVRIMPVALPCWAPDCAETPSAFMGWFGPRGLAPAAAAQESSTSDDAGLWSGYEHDHSEFLARMDRLMEEQDRASR